MQKTFDARHAPYTNGTKKLKGLTDPEVWKQQQSVKRKRSRRSKKTQRQGTPPPTAGANNAEYIYDSEEDECLGLVDFFIFVHYRFE